MAALASGVLVWWLITSWASTEPRAASPFSGHTLWASVAVAAGSALLALVVGFFLAVLYSLTDFPLAFWWGTCAMVPFVCPPTVWALAQSYCYGPSGTLEQLLGDPWRPGLDWLNRGQYLPTIVVLAQIHVPIVFVLLSRGLSRLPRGGFEAACFYLPGWRRVTWVLGASQRELASAWLLAFALAVGNFAVPHVLQCRLFVIDVYSRMTNYLDPAGATRSAFWLLLVAAVAAIGAGCLLPESKAVPGPQRTYRLKLGRGVWPCAVILSGYLGLTVVVPWLALLSRIRSWDRFVQAMVDAAPETGNSLQAGLGAGACVVVVCCLLASAVPRRSPTVRGSISLVTTAALAVPPILIGLLVAWSVRSTEVIQDWLPASSRWPLLIGLVARGWPFAIRILDEGRRQSAPEWWEAARLGGLRGWRRRWWLDGPLAVPDLAAGVVLVFALAVSDVEITQMLCPAGGGTLALRLFTFLHFGPVHIIASLALMQGVLALAPVLVYCLLREQLLRLV